MVDCNLLFSMFFLSFHAFLMSLNCVFSFGALFIYVYLNINFNLVIVFSRSRDVFSPEYPIEITEIFNKSIWNENAVLEKHIKKVRNFRKIRNLSRGLNHSSVV